MKCSKRADSVLVRHFVDHRQKRIHDVSRAGREGESVGHQRRYDRHLFWIFADDSLRHPHKKIDPTRHLHRRRGHDDGEHDEQHIARQRRRRDSKARDKH